MTTAGSTLAKELGLCAVDTWNMNTWHAGIAAIASSTADAVLLQETRIVDAEACLRAEDGAHAKCWSMKMNRAITTQEGGASAGVAIMTKRHIGMKSDHELVAKRHRPRLTCAWIGTGRKGGLHVLSAYLWTKEGMTARNKELLDEAARITKLLKGPWILGGDFNMRPELLQSWATDNRASIHCTAAPTCNANVYDYFIVHRSLTSAIVGVQSIGDVGGRPHVGARLLVNARRSSELVWTMKKPKQIPSILPCGCKIFILDYSLSKVLGKQSTKDEISAALAQWYSLAEGELVDIMGLTKEEAVAYTGRAEGASFTRKPLSGRRNSEHAGAGDAAKQWRKLATWATTILRATNNPSGPKGLTWHAEVLTKKIMSEGNWKAVDKERQNELLSFTRQLTTDKLQSKESLAMIIKTASKVASQLEDADKETSAASWKKHVRGKVGGCGKRGVRLRQRSCWLPRSP